MTTSAIKCRQAEKIGEIAAALARVGYLTLDEQANVLGLARSTTWTVIKHSHKASGLSASVINRMLAAPRLPTPVREKINEYVCERLSGTYGHSQMQLRRFAWRLSGVMATAAEVIEKVRHHGPKSRSKQGSCNRLD